MRTSIRLLLLLCLLLIFFEPALGQIQGPSPEFVLTIQAERQSVEAGQPVIISVSRRNVTGHIIENNRTTNPMEYLTFRVTCGGEPVNGTAELLKMRGIGLRAGEVHTLVTSPYFAKLKPGESSHDTVEISYYYDLAKPGTYAISASQETRPGSPEKSMTVRSNTITVRVLPTENQPVPRK